MEACLFDIQRRSVRHGPGMRTVVRVKGCPLHCIWCKEPDIQRFRPQLIFDAARCVGCKECVRVCRNRVHTVSDDGHGMNLLRCNACGRCVDVCQNGALELCGQAATIDEVFASVYKERDSYLPSGGVTVAGGEPLSQADFTAQLLERCRRHRIHTCVETSGYGSPQALRTVMPVTDLFLFHWKISDRNAAMRHLGVSLSPILRSFNTLMKAGCKLILRCQIVAGINDTDAHFQSMMSLMDQYPALEGVELVPRWGTGQHVDLSGRSPVLRRPSEGLLEVWQAYFHDRGYSKVKMVL